VEAAVTGRYGVCDVDGCAEPAVALITIRRWDTASLLSWLGARLFPEQRRLCREHIPSHLSEFIRGGVW
jgi:hypothetical protein